jgi:excisionase family DNA binding protein
MGAVVSEFITRWITLHEAAGYAGVSEATLRREAKAGHLRGYKIGGRRVWRFKVTDIDAYFETVGGERLKTERSVR